MSAGSFSRAWRHLHIPWGVKKKSRESKLPEVSANLYCAISLTHSCIQKLESKLVIVPATTLADNFMVPKPDEVRLVRVLGSL